VEEKRFLNKVIILRGFCTQKVFSSLQPHMDYCNCVFTTFLALESCNDVAAYEVSVTSQISSKRS